MISGAVYGVLLNDTAERQALASAFVEPPYKEAPKAPVVYIKPRSCLTVGGAAIPIPVGVDALEIAGTIGLLFSRDVTTAPPDAAVAAIGAACLAIDVCIPHDSYYRPAIAERCRDGFLPLGKPGALGGGDIDIITSIDGEEAHRWSLSRLFRPIGSLISDLSAFMTLRAGDMLLVGLPVDAPLAHVGQTILCEAASLAPIETHIVQEVLS